MRALLAHEHEREWQSNESNHLRSSPTNPNLVVFHLRLMMSFHPKGILTALDRLLSVQCQHPMGEVAGVVDASEIFLFQTQVPPADASVAMVSWRMLINAS